ncbi:MAG: hypothetical protein JRN22_00725 [Nitrososphaerota archaeon]|nr:hypothetical protein [Nitrososphaerota archaeon]
MEYSISSKAYLDRARKQLDENTKEGLFYAAFELRCGIESRLLQYWDANQHIHEMKKSGWEIPKIARDLEKAFIRKDKVARFDVLDSTSGEVRISLYFTPVTKDLEALGGKIGNLMHCPKVFRDSDDPWWDETRELLEQAYAQLKKANKGMLLGVPVLQRETNKIHLEMEVRPGENIEDLQGAIGKVGQSMLVEVKYLDDLPENV